MRNIIAVTFDSLRADHCGYIGYERDTTPSLDWMAKNGISFENAIAPASRTNPSMAGIMTGSPLVVRDKVSNRKLSSEHIEKNETIAQELSNEGYNTGAFCPNAYSSRYYGFDNGFDYFEDFLFQNDLYQKIFRSHLSDSNLVTWVRNVRNFLRREEAFKSWETYIDDMEKWVGNNDESFFLWAFSLDTHFPYVTPRKYRKWGSLFEMIYYNWRCNQLIDKFNIELSDKEKESIVNIYDDSIRYGDILIKELQNKLEEFNPIFVIFGDHGEAFGERGMYGHFYPSLYEENIHVPLVIWGEDVPEMTIEEPFSLLDLKEIIHKLSQENYDFSINNGRVTSTDYDGRWERELISQKIGDWKIIKETNSGRASYELYDLNEDKHEENNLLGENEPNGKYQGLINSIDIRHMHENELVAIKRATENIQ